MLGPARSHDEQQLWVEIWARARQEGPLLGSRLRDQLQQANRHELTLCLVTALGLGGGASARSALTNVLASGKTSDRILASFAYIQDRVVADKNRFLICLNKGQKSQALFLAGRLSLLASRWKIQKKEFLGRARSSDISRVRPLLNALLLARKPKMEVDGLELPSLGKKVPPVGSLADHEERALLILACARPGQVSRAQLLAFLDRPQGARHFDLCSLALGRLDKFAQSKPKAGNLVAPFYLLGLETCSEELQEELIKGPGPAHSIAWQSWHWCAAVQLLPGSRLESLLPPLLAADPEVGDMAIEALCFRVLMRGEILPESESIRSLVENPVSPASSPYRSILALLSAPARSPGQDRRKVLGPLRSYALQSWREGRIQGEKRVAGAQLWRLLSRVEWSRPVHGPGSFEAVLLENLNALVRDLLILGSEFVERTQPGLIGKERFLPAGVRRTDESYFRVLDAYLGIYPLFRSW